MNSGTYQEIKWNSRLFLFYAGLATFMTLGVPYCVRLIFYYTSQWINWPNSQGFYEIMFYSLQLILGLTIYYFVVGKSALTLKLLNPKPTKQEIWVIHYLLIWLCIVVGFYITSHYLNPNFIDYVVSWWQPTKQSFNEDFVSFVVLAGLFEEPFFRGIITQFLLVGTGISFKVMRTKEKASLVIVSGVLFSIAHIYYQVKPFIILPLDWTQLITTFIVGCIWSYFYLKSGKLLGPILAHTGANAIQMLTGYVYLYVLEIQFF